MLLLIKLALHPLLALGILSFIGGFDRVWVETAVLMASLPPAATIYLIATQYNTYVLRASTAILVGTAASIFTRHRRALPDHAWAVAAKPLCPLASQLPLLRRGFAVKLRYQAEHRDRHR